MTIAAATLTACGDVVGVPAQLVFTVQPSDAVAGHDISPAVQVTLEDIHGHRVRGSRDAITLALGSAPGGATLSGPLTIYAADGVALFARLSINRADLGYTLVASAAGLASTSSQVFAISASAPAQLAFTGQPSTGDGMQPITPAVQVAIEDGFGNIVPSATRNVALTLDANPFSGALGGTTAVAAVDGVATFPTLTVNAPGEGYALVASALGLASATSDTFGVHVTFAAVTAGGFHTCAITPAHVAYCWGGNGAGQLGSGTTTERHTPAAVAGGLMFASLTAGYGHTCGITQAGIAYCWGSNVFGQLGDGTYGYMAEWLTPVAVAGALTFASGVAGEIHTCGATAAGVSYCWGENSFGQLGDGTTTTSTTPVVVSGGVTFASVTVGHNHTCGVTPGGAAYCWGSDFQGQLGSDTIPGSRTPIAVSGGLTFATVTAGSYHTCGVTPAGAAYCWGIDSTGQLGDGTTTESNTPAPVVGGLTFAALSAGYGHTCGITSAGVMYCWGANKYGQLGDGTTTNRTVPVAVAGGLTFASVTSGYYRTCGVTEDGTAYCWGDNTYGQLGDGTTAPSYTPARVVQ